MHIVCMLFENFLFPMIIVVISTILKAQLILKLQNEYSHAPKQALPLQQNISKSKTYHLIIGVLNI